MSETEPIPPTSSVTALRIPIIKKGEYDLWSMKMRQYIAITDHILWDIITNGNQTTQILILHLPQHLLQFHDAVDAKISMESHKSKIWEETKHQRRWQGIYEIICSFFSQQASMPTTHDDEDLLLLDEDARKKIDIMVAGGLITARIRKKKEDLWLLKIQTQKALDLAQTTMKILIGTKDFDDESSDICYDGIDWISLALMATNSEDLGLSLVIVWKVTFHLGDETLTDSTYELQRRKGLQGVPPPTGTHIHLGANVPLQGIDELAIRNKVVNQMKKQTIETAFNKNNSEESFENSSYHLIKDCNLHERTFQHTQTHKSKGTQGSRETRPVWNNIQRVNHSNFARNSRNLHQRRSFIPSAVLTRDGLISTARPKMTQTVPSKSTANVTYQGTARSRVPQAVLSRSTDGSYYPRMDNRRPRISSYSPSSRSSTTRTPHRPHRPKKIVKSIWVKKGSTVESQAVLPQTVKKSAMINPKQTWRPKGNYLDSVNRDNGSYTLKQFEYGNPEEDLKDYAIIDSGCSGSMTGDKDKLSDFKEFKGGYVAFGNDSKGGRISGKGTIKTSCLDFEKVSYVEELKFNLLSVSQICDKKHNVLFTDKECLILSPKFKFVDEDLVILRAPRKNDVYSLDLKNM
ncbi:hypothetical protein Tco_0676087 [Tanacetum coccineum]